MSSPAPFYPYPPGTPELPQQVADGMCDSCGGAIEPGDRSVELFLGVWGAGRKSGQGMVVENPQDREFPVAKLHPQCVRDFAHHFVWEEEDSERFCSACDAKLDPDDES